MIHEGRSQKPQTWRKGYSPSMKPLDSILLLAVFLPGCALTRGAGMTLAALFFQITSSIWLALLFA